MNAAAPTKCPAYAGFLNNPELERLALDELRSAARHNLNRRSLKQADWDGARAAAGAAGLEIDEMNVAQLRGLITELKKVPLWNRGPENVAPKKREKVAVGKAFGWARR